MTTPGNLNIFVNVVDTYFATKAEAGIDRKVSIIEACIATGIEYNPSMYSRWVKSPQQEIIRYMQIVVGKDMLMKAIPTLSEQDASVLAGNLAVPVEDEVLERISKFMTNPDAQNIINNKANIIKEISRLALKVKKLKARKKDDLVSLAAQLGRPVSETTIELLAKHLNAPKGKKGDKNIYRLENHTDLNGITEIVELASDLALIEAGKYKKAA